MQQLEVHVIVMQRHELDLCVNQVVLTKHYLSHAPICIFWGNLASEAVSA